MAFFPISQYTPATATATATLIYLILVSCTPTPILCLNITHLLSPYPDLSDFTKLLVTTSVATDLTQLSSLTLLAVPNTFLRSSRLPSPTHLPDILRYHILLQFTSLPTLNHIPPTGKLFTTLYQTTGRATANSGSLNITHNPTTNTISLLSPTSNSTILSLIKTIPYNITIFSINSLLIPDNFDLMASETRPPLGLNITKALLDGHNFNVAATLLAASGVVDEFEADEGGAGITLFIPTDSAFSYLPPTAKFQSLPADKKTVVLKFHVLHSYYPLGSLESIVNPVQPTLATETMGAGRFTLNISTVNGSLALNTGIVQATVTQTVFDENPVAIFGVSRVLLPMEIFVNNKMGVNNNEMSGAQPPGTSLSPGSLPPLYGPSTQMPSEATNNVVQKSNFALCFIGILYVLL